MNLLEETREELQAHKLSPSDIIFIGSTSSGHSCTWAEFELLADFEYDDDYGSQEIASDLKIVFTDRGFFERQEYDGSECWGYSKAFVMPLQRKKITCLGGPRCYGDHLAGMNK